MDTVRIPVLGRIATGHPIAIPASDFSLFDAEETIEMSLNLLPVVIGSRNLFALQVQGNGLMDASIVDGDIVVLEAASKAADGEIVAAWLPDKNETFLARMYGEPDAYRFEAAHPAIRPIMIRKQERVEVKGTVAALVRVWREEKLRSTTP
jgi:repressor LexA